MAHDPSPLCALPAPLPLPSARRVLVLAPHPDDECIGCGGLIATLLARGVPVKVVLVTDGAGAGGLPAGAAEVRQREFRRSLVVMGVGESALLGFPDGELALDDALIDAVKNEVRRFSPNWLLAPSSADAHRDHRCVALAARAAAMASATVEQLLEYETWTPVSASHVLDISGQLAIKLAALDEHATALAHGNYRAATEGLARYRSLLLGGPRADGAAEAYLMLGRDTDFAWPPGLGQP